jgi:hypothetical protein
MEYAGSSPALARMKTIIHILNTMFSMKKCCREGCNNPYYKTYTFLHKSKSGFKDVCKEHYPGYDRIQYNMGGNVKYNFVDGKWIEINSM